MATSEISPKGLADEVRQIYRSNNPEAEILIEGYLKTRLHELSPREKSVLLEKLMTEFSSDDSNIPVEEDLEFNVLSRLFSLLLGKKVSYADLSSDDILDRLATSLNTVFDTLNRLVGVINTTLLSGGVGDETIRHVLVSHMEGEDQSRSLESYLDQVRTAFLATQQAFKDAAHSKVKEILAELDPDQMASDLSGGIKFGPLRKAELFETYKEKFQRCKKWFESGRFTEDFLREFEKNCQKELISE